MSPAKTEPERGTSEYWRRVYLKRRAGAAGVYCVICGSGPYTAVTQHSRRAHGIGRAEYKRRFPGAPVTHPDYLEAFKLQAKENGATAAAHRRRRACKRGHALRGSNRLPNGGCRRCKNEHANARLAERHRGVVAATGTHPCACGCGTEIPNRNRRGERPRFAQGHHLTRAGRAVLRADSG